jgi:acetyl esterase/lipase
MPSTPPETVEDILAAGVIDPIFAEAWDDLPMPPGSDYDVNTLKELSKAGLPGLQRRLENGRPPDISETTHFIKLRDDWESRIILCHHKDDLAENTPPRPLIVLFHGGGHTIGYPENMITLAREIIKEHRSIIICASYRLAPRFPFPFSICDSWETLHWAAEESRKLNATILPTCTDPRVGFIVGGESAGANIASALAHVARNYGLVYEITGQFLCAGTYLSPEHVPDNYKHRYLSRTQDTKTPLLDEDLHALFRTAHKPDHTSKLWASMDQHHPDDQGTGGLKNGNMGLPPTYFQVCGLDMSRDDGLIYEKVLREECGVSTRLDLYKGWPHCWWGVYPHLEISKRRMRDTVEGFGWLLKVGKEKKVDESMSCEMR